MSSPTATQAPLKAGTLVYTPASLRILFVWLLAGDVLFMLCEQIESRILPIILKSHDATDTQIALIVTSVQSIVTCIAAPIVSYHSDRTRSKWGRRIPYIVWTLPFFTLAMAATPFAPELATWASGIPLLRDCMSWFSWSPVILTFALVAIFYRFLQVIIVSMFFALFRDVVPMSHMGRFLALFRICGSLSTFLVTFWLIGLAETHSRSIFVVFAILNFVGFSLICLKVKEGNYPPDADHIAAQQRAAVWTRFGRAIRTFLKDAYTDPLIFWTFCARGFATAATGISSFIVFFPQRELGIPLDQAGMILSAPIFIWIIAAYPIGRLMDRVGAAPILGFALMLSTVNYAVSFFAVSGPVTFAVSSIIGGVGYWAMMLSQLQLAQEVFPVARYGQLSSANLLQTSVLLAFLITPLVGLSLDFLRNLELIIALPLAGDLAVGPYRSVNLMLALVFILAWLCLQKVQRLRAARAALASV